MADDDTLIAKPTIIPTHLKAVCPVCEVAIDDVELTEDDTGTWAARDEHQFHACSCGAVLDLGWAGWRFHATSRPFDR